MLEKVKNLLASQLGIKPDRITEKSRILEDLGADSLDLVELLMTLEDEFNVMVDYEQVLHVNTIQEIIDEIKKYVKE